LPEAAGGLGRFGLDHEMEVLGHQHLANQPKTRFLSKLAQNIDEVETQTMTTEELGATIGAGGDKLQLPKLKVAAVDWHRQAYRLART
jgi:hypothetical protein